MLKDCFQNGIEANSSTNPVGSSLTVQYDLDSCKIEIKVLFLNEVVFFSNCKTVFGIPIIDILSQTMSMINRRGGGGVSD